MTRYTYFDGTSYTALSSKAECVQELGRLEDEIEKAKQDNKNFPLSLKDLESRINQPVYVVDNIDKWFNGWYLIRDVDDKKVELNEECYVVVKDIGKNVVFYDYEVGE